MEKLEDILNYWDVDSKIDQTEPGRALLKIPELHNKYLRILSSHRMSLKKIMFEYNKIRRLKWEYYSGKMDEETLQQYGWEPFKYVLKSEVDTYLNSDIDLSNLLLKKAYYEETISVCESILNELKQRTWQLKSFIDYEKFIGGV